MFRVEGVGLRVRVKNLAFRAPGPRGFSTSKAFLGFKAFRA